MKDYKEAIEKEAEKYAIKDFGCKSSFEFHTQYTSFIEGVNSKIVERIKEIEKRKYASKVLELISCKLYCVKDRYVLTELNKGLQAEISELENKLI